MNARTKRNVAMVLAWPMSFLVGAGVLSLFVRPGDEDYASSVAGMASISLTIVIVIWVMSARPRRNVRLWLITLAITVPATLVGLLFGPVYVLPLVVGGLVFAVLLSLMQPKEKGTQNVG